MAGALSAAHRPILRAGADQLGKAKVRNLDDGQRACGRGRRLLEQQILRLEIAVHNVPRMQVAQSLQQLLHDVACIGLTERAALDQMIEELRSTGTAARGAAGGGGGGAGE